MTDRADGWWWVKWLGELRSSHPWQVLEVKSGVIQDRPRGADPRPWEWGPYLGKEPAGVEAPLYGPPQPIRFYGDPEGMWTALRYPDGDQWPTSPFLWPGATKDFTAPEASSP